MCGTDCFLMLLSVLFPPIGGEFPAFWTLLVSFQAPPSKALLHISHSTSHKANSTLVWVKRGLCGADSLINIALCCLGFLPGLIHAWYIILKYPDPYEYEGLQDGERGGDGSVTYYYVSRGPAPPPRGGANGQTSYGTVGSQPSGGQFPGQQAGTTNSFPQPKPQPQQQRQQPQQNAQPQYGVAGQELGGGQGSSEQPGGPPPTYADVIKGDNKVQKP